MTEHEDTDLRTGAKAAAAAAAVGAAVGVARAIAARAEDAAHRNDDDEREEEPVEAEAQQPEPVAEDVDEEDEQQDEDEEQEPVHGTSVDRVRRLTRSARELLQELNGADVESVSAIDQTRDGWRVTLETVEVRRIPDSMDVMATYDVELDGDGDLVRYERRRRYARAQSDHGDGR